MVPIPKNRLKLILILGTIPLIFVIIIRVPITLLTLNNGNSTEVAVNIADTVSLIIAMASFTVSLIAMVLTYNSLEITQNTLERTEKEQQIRDIEQRLELFYNPMSSYFKISVGRETKRGMNEDDRRERIRAYQHRFKANDETRKQFEEWYKHITGRATTGKAGAQQKLIKYIEEDIEKHNNRIQDLNKQIQELS